MFHEQSAQPTASRNPRKPLCALLISSCLVSAVLSGDKDKEIHRLLLCCRGSFARNSNNSENLLQFGQARQRQWVTTGKKQELELWNVFQLSPPQEKTTSFCFLSTWIALLTGDNRVFLQLKVLQHLCFEHSHCLFADLH